jgi:hypothetical protein
MAINKTILGPQSWREYPAFWLEAIRWQIALRKARKLIKGIKRADGEPTTFPANPPHS